MEKGLYFSQVYTYAFRSRVSVLYGKSIFNFLRDRLFSKKPAPFYKLISRFEGFSFSISLTAPVTVCYTV